MKYKVIDLSAPHNVPRFSNVEELEGALNALAAEGYVLRHLQLGFAVMEHEEDASARMQAVLESQAQKATQRFAEIALQRVQEHLAEIMMQPDEGGGDQPGGIVMP